MPLLRFGLSNSHVQHRVEAVSAFAAALGSRLSAEVKPEIFPDYGMLLRATLSGVIELAWLPPLLVVQAMEKGGKLVAMCSRDDAITYRSAILVAAKSRFQSVDDLRGGAIRLAWTDPSSAAGHVFPRRFLVDSGLDPARDFKSEEFFGSARGACVALVSDLADVSATFANEASVNDGARILAKLVPVYARAPQDLRVLAVTPPIPADGFVVAPHVADDVGRAITSVLLSLHQTSAGREPLAQLTSAERLLAAGPEAQRLLDGLPQPGD